VSTTGSTSHPVSERRADHRRRKLADRAADPGASVLGAGRVVVGNLLISLLKHADRVTSASTQPGVLLAIHNASLVGASPGTHRGHTVKSSNSKQGKTTTGLIPSDSQRGSPRTRWGRPSSTCSFKAAALARPSSMTNRHQRLRLQPLPPTCPRTPNTDRRWLSLAVNSRSRDPALDRSDDRPPSRTRHARNASLGRSRRAGGLTATTGRADNPDVAKPLRCRLRLHNWEHRENPRPKSATRSVFAVTPTGHRECSPGCWRSCSHRHRH
jgi:hypothetical protein